MVLTCGDGEAPSEMMRFGAVVGNCVLFGAVVTGDLPQLCPSKIGENRPRSFRANVRSAREPGLGASRAASS